MAEKNPEIERRRAIRQRKSRRKHLLIALLVFLLIALVVLAILTVTVMFPIKVVKATGSAIYTDEQLIEYSGIMGENILLANVDDIEENLRSELPFIDTVKIDKSFPDTVSIKVTDAREYACYKVGSNYYVVSKKGYVLKKMIKKPESLMELKCSKVECEVSKKVEFGDTTSKENCEKIINILESNKIKINSVDTVSKYNLKAVVDDRFEVTFGSGTDLDKKCSHLIGMIREIDKDASGTIDLSAWTQNNRQGTFKKKTAQ